MPAQVAETTLDLIARLPPIYRVALVHAPLATKARLAALLSLHNRCDALVRRASEPLPAQFRLVWHRGVLSGEAAVGKPDPELESIIALWGQDASRLVPVIDGWEEVLGESPDLRAASQAAAKPFRVIAESCGRSAAELEAVVKSGERWVGTVFGLARRFRGDEAIMPDAGERIALPRTMRPLAVLDGMARRALLQQRNALLGDRFSPFAAIRLGILGR